MRQKRQSLNSSFWRSVSRATPGNRWKSRVKLAALLWVKCFYIIMLFVLKAVTILKPAWLNRSRFSVRLSYSKSTTDLTSLRKILRIKLVTSQNLSLKLNSPPSRSSTLWTELLEDLTLWLMMQLRRLPRNSRMKKRSVDKPVSLDNKLISKLLPVNKKMDPVLSSLKVNWTLSLERDLKLKLLTRK